MAIYMAFLHARNFADCLNKREKLRIKKGRLQRLKMALTLLMGIRWGDVLANR
jgi:hypothetical protein